MPSPFPGMDPYLEEPSLWPDLHQRLIAYISEALQPQVRPKYLARIGERVEVASLMRLLATRLVNQRNTLRAKTDVATGEHLAVGTATTD